LKKERGKKKYILFRLCKKKKSNKKSYYPYYINELLTEKNKINIIFLEGLKTKRRKKKTNLLIELAACCGKVAASIPFFFTC